MKKTVSAFVFAAITLCAAPALYAKTVAHKPAKAAAVKKVSNTVSAAPARVVKTSNVSRKSKSSSPYWQCVTFARSLTGMQIFGDAWTWWGNATGRYEEGHTPKPGAVLVFKSQGKMTRGHVAVVSQIITERYVQVTHANWSPINGHRGQVEDHVNVMDVSDKGDWSKVKVWYGPLNDFGTTTYVTYGFIYQDTAEGKAAAQEIIAKSEELPDAPVAYPQIAAAAPVQQAELPASLKAALTPGNDKGFLSVRANTVAAHVTGADAAAIVSRVESDAAAAHIASPKPDATTTGKTLSRP